MINNYIEIQLFAEDDELLMKRKNALSSFCTAFGVKCRIVDDHHGDTFLIDLPAPSTQENWRKIYLLLNAIDAFCCFHESVHALRSEKISIPFDEFLKGFSYL